MVLFRFVDLMSASNLAISKDSENLLLILSLIARLDSGLILLKPQELFSVNYLSFL
jgi:hypothetical protein